MTVNTPCPGDSLLVVVFSYNRALQLEYTLRKLRENLLCLGMQIEVVYHTKGEPHKLAYEQLRREFPDIAFHERGPARSFWVDIFPRLFNIRNLYRYLKYSYLRRNRDNFKELIDGVIRRSPMPFVMFLTDDEVCYAPQVIDQDVFALIRADPRQVSFRCYVGLNNFDVPKNMRREGNYLAWNYYDPTMYRHWAYPFAVDGTVYDKAALLEVLRPMIYHMPTTLEAFGVSDVTAKRLFSRGYSPLRSSMLALQLNRVASSGTGASAHFDVDELNAAYLEGWRLAPELPDINDNGIRPGSVLLRRGDETREVRDRQEIEPGVSAA